MVWIYNSVQASKQNQVCSLATRNLYSIQENPNQHLHLLPGATQVKVQAVLCAHGILLNK